MSSNLTTLNIKKPTKQKTTNTSNKQQLSSSINEQDHDLRNLLCILFIGSKSPKTVWKDTFMTYNCKWSHLLRMTVQFTTQTKPVVAEKPLISCSKV